MSKFPDKMLCLSFVLISRLDFSCTTIFTCMSETCGPVKLNTFDMAIFSLFGDEKHCTTKERVIKSVSRKGGTD